ncbi:MAG: flippase [Bacteroidetes bacterium]|nr:flippase [Bacteroidota bacterium]
MVSIKKNLVYNAILSISQVLIPLITMPYLSRVLNPDGIGQVNFIDSFANYFISIAELGMVVYSIREVARASQDKKKLNKLVSELFVLHFITSCIAILIYLLFVAIFSHKIHDYRLVWFALAYILVNAFSCEWYYWGKEQFRFITIRSLITRFLGLVAMFLLVRHPDDYYLYYAIIISAGAGNIIWNNILLFRKIDFHFRGLNWKRHLRFLWVTFAMTLAYDIPFMLDNVILGFAGTVFAVGIYSMGIKIVRIAGVVVTDIFHVYYPRMVRLIKENNICQLKAAVSQSLQLINTLTIPISVGILIFSDVLVKPFLGNKFLQVSTDLRILAFYPFVKSYSIFLSKQILISYQLDKMVLQTLVVGSIIFVLFGYFFSVKWLDKGMCAATMLTEMAVIVLNYYYAKRRLPHSIQLFDTRSFLYALISSVPFIGFYFLAKNFWQNSSVVLFVSAPLSIVSYFLVQKLVFKNALVEKLTAHSISYFFQSSSRRIDVTE